MEHGDFGTKTYSLSDLTSNEPATVPDAVVTVAPKTVPVAIGVFFIFVPVIKLVVSKVNGNVIVQSKVPRPDFVPETTVLRVAVKGHLLSTVGVDAVKVKPVLPVRNEPFSLLVNVCVAELHFVTFHTILPEKKVGLPDCCFSRGSNVIDVGIAVSSDLYIFIVDVPHVAVAASARCMGA